MRAKDRFLWDCSRCPCLSLLFKLASSHPHPSAVAKATAKIQIGSVRGDMSRIGTRHLGWTTYLLHTHVFLWTSPQFIESSFSPIPAGSRESQVARHRNALGAASRTFEHWHCFVVFVDYIAPTMAQVRLIRYRNAPSTIWIYWQRVQSL